MIWSLTNLSDRPFGRSAHWLREGGACVFSVWKNMPTDNVAFLLQLFVSSALQFCVLSDDNQLIIVKMLTPNLHVSIQKPVLVGF